MKKSLRLIKSTYDVLSSTKETAVLSQKLSLECIAATFFNVRLLLEPWKAQVELGIDQLEKDMRTNLLEVLSDQENMMGQVPS